MTDRNTNLQNPHFLVSVAMLGSRMHYAVPIILERDRLLNTFYTDFYVGNKPWLKRLFRILPMNRCPTTLQRLYGRTADDIPPDKVVSFDIFGMWYWWKSRGIRSYKDMITLYAEANRTFGEHVIKHSLYRATAVYGFNGASLEIFRFAKQKGITCILEQTLAPRRIEKKLLNEEINRWPEWQSGLIFEDESDHDPLAEREEAEWTLADVIIGGSSFVTDCMHSLGVGSEKCKVVPYGIEVERFSSIKKNRGSDLNILFIGEIGLRKGVPYLLGALRKLNSHRIKAKLVGPISINPRRLADYSDWCDVVGPIPRLRIKEFYQWADIFVFPSICEGSATVIYEALASGLPVVTTPNAGSVVQDGINGFVVPIRDIDAICDKIFTLQENKSLRQEMSELAVKKAQEYTLERYSQRLLEIIHDL